MGVDQADSALFTGEGDGHALADARAQVVRKQPHDGCGLDPRQALQGGLLLPEAEAEEVSADIVAEHVEDLVAAEMLQADGFDGGRAGDHESLVARHEFADFQQAERTGTQQKQANDGCEHAADGGLRQAAVEGEAKAGAASTSAEAAVLLGHGLARSGGAKSLRRAGHAAWTCCLRPLPPTLREPFLRRRDHPVPLLLLLRLLWPNFCRPPGPRDRTKCLAAVVEYSRLYPLDRAWSPPAPCGGRIQRGSC